MFKDKRMDIGGAGTAIETKVARKIFCELENYLKEPIEKISEEYWRRKDMEEREKQNKICKIGNNEEILNYYKITDHFLYELIYWEALKSKQIEFKKIYLFCRRNKINRLLDFGGGVGGLSLFMAHHALECDYLDIPGKTFDFAKWRFQQKDLTVQLHTNPEDLPPLTYDAVVAYDVLEHLFDVEEAIQKIASSLKNKGYFISKSTFGEEGLHLAKNKKFQDMRIFDAMMQKYNFNFLGQLKDSLFCRLLKNLGIKYVSFGLRIKKRLKYGGNFIIYQKNC